MTKQICDCGARVRKNYPFGKKSKARYTLVKDHGKDKHGKDCKFKGTTGGFIERRRRKKHARKKYR